MTNSPKVKFGFSFNIFFSVLKTMKKNSYPHKNSNTRMHLHMILCAHHDNTNLCYSWGEKIKRRRVHNVCIVVKYSEVQIRSNILHFFSLHHDHFATRLWAIKSVDCVWRTKNFLMKECLSFTSIFLKMCYEKKKIMQKVFNFKAFEGRTRPQYF